MRKIFVLAILCPLLCLGQMATNNNAPLSIGDTVPDIALPNIINYHSSSASLSSFKGKLVILDFFATWCLSCIRELPKLESLQKQFAGNMQIVLVTQQLPSQLIAFRKTNKVFAACTLPVIIADSTLHNLFPHRLLPHQVWLKERKVMAITTPEELNAPNLLSALSGKNPDLPLKEDVMDFNPNTPLLQNGNGGTEDNLVFRAALTRYLEGMPATAGRSVGKSSTRYYYINLPLLTLYQTAYSFPGNRIVLELNDSGRYIMPPTPSTQWKIKNLYSFELTVPTSTPQPSIKKLIAQNLDLYFGLRSRMEIRCIPCSVLVRKDGQKIRLATKGGKPSVTHNGEWVVFNNKPLAALVDRLNGVKYLAPGQPVFLDETGFTGDADIQLPLAALDNLQMLQHYLETYGLAIEPVERNIEVFVLTDNPLLAPSNSTTNPNQKQ